MRLIGPDHTIELHRLFAGFAGEAALLRARRGAPIEAKRRSDVEVLIGDLERGRIYAGLPTRQRVPARMLLAGDFFPHSSRKVISLEHDLRSDWNRAALRAGAKAVAESLEALPSRIGALSTWELIASMRRTTAVEDDEAFAAYWPIVAAAARDAAILPTAAGNLVAASDALFVAAEEDDPALGLLDELGGAVPIPELRRILAPLPRSDDLGMRDLGPSTLAGLLDAYSIGELSADSRRTLWELMDRMLRRARAGKGLEGAQARLMATSTAPEVDGELVTWDDLSAADAATVELFRPYANLLDDAAVARLDDLRMMASPFKVGDAIGALEQASSGDLERPLDLLRWFADRRGEIRAEADLQVRLKALPIFPAQRDHGQRRVFAALSAINLAADRKGATFSDVIGIATVLDTSIDEDIVVFAKELGIEILDLTTYVDKHAVPALRAAGDDAPPWLDELLGLLAGHVDELEGAPGLIDALAELDLVPCSDGRHRRPADAYFNTQEVLEVFGDDTPVAVVPERVRYLVDRLGVASEPRPHDVLRRVKEVCARPPSPASIYVIQAVLRHFARLVPPTDDATTRVLARQSLLSEYGELTNGTWLPARGQRDHWFSPGELYRDDEQRLFASQAHFLDVPTELRNSSRLALEALGVEVQAPLEAIVAHLIHCGANGMEPHLDIYRRLNDNAADDALEPLATQAVLALSDGLWARPDEVFWEDHHLAPYAHRLDAAAWDQWRPLLNRLGVRSQPDHRDALRVLRSVSADHAGIRVDEAIEHLVLRSWQILESALASSELQPTAIRSGLGNVASVIDAAHILARPPEVFVNDSPELARRFAHDLGNAIVTRPRGAWNALRAAGVRGLREWSLPQVRHAGEATRFSVLTRHIRDREPQIARVFEDAAGSADLAAAFVSLRSLVTFKATDLEAQWIFKPDPRVRTPWSRVLAVYDRSGHRLVVGGELEGDIWIDVARELAGAIAPDGGSLGLLKDVLAADDPADADLMLDRLDVPRLTGEVPDAGIDEIVGPGGHDEPAPDQRDGDVDDVVGAETAPDANGSSDAATTDASQGGQSENGTMEDSGGTGGTAGGAGEATGDRTAGGASGGSTGSRGSGGASGSAGRAGRVERSRREAEPSERWYVIVSGRSDPSEDRDLGRDEQERAARRSKIDKAGIAAVCRHERQAGRVPEVMPPNHPGYDIASRDEEGGAVRLIEVKSLAGSWGDGGFPRLTPTQFDHARENDDAWLYVVERAESTGPAITRIHDPADKVDRFVFDPGWRVQANRTTNWGRFRRRCAAWRRGTGGRCARSRGRSSSLRPSLAARDASGPLADPRLPRHV